MILVKIIRTAILFVRTVNYNNIPAYSAYVAFFLFISIFPITVIILTLINLTPISSEILIEFTHALVPDTLDDTLVNWINEVHIEHTNLLPTSIIITLWSASKGFLGIINSFNRIYETKRGRNYIIKRILAMLYTFTLISIVIATMSILILGNHLKILLDSSHVFRYVSKIIDFRIVLAIGLFLMILLLLYTFVPNRKSHIKNELPGAAFTSCGWILFSWLYSLYIDYIENANSIYGSLTTIVLLMLWMYFSMYIMFVGALINNLLSKLNRCNNA